jgi:hypothetical protein
MLPAASAMLTVGKIADRLGVPVHRVEYVLRTRPIQPKGWAGNARVYDEDALAAIQAVFVGDREQTSVEADRHAAR